MSALSAQPDAAPPPALAPADTSEFDALRTRLAGIEGFLHDEEGYALFRFARARPVPGAILEIGSFMGRSTAWLASGASHAGKERVTAVDHFKGSPEHRPGGTHAVGAIARAGSTYPQFDKNLRARNLRGWVTPIVRPSLEAAGRWAGPIRLLFIDGDHTYSATLNDFHAWAPFVVRGAHVAFHDVGAWPGVTEFYKELLETRGGYTEVESVRSLRIVRRDA